MFLKGQDPKEKKKGKRIVRAAFILYFSLPCRPPVNEWADKWKKRVKDGGSCVSTVHRPGKESLIHGRGTLTRQGTVIHSLWAKNKKNSLFWPHRMWQVPWPLFPASRTSRTMKRNAGPRSGKVFVRMRAADEFIHLTSWSTHANPHKYKFLFFLFSVLGL